MIVDVLDDALVIDGLRIDLQRWVDAYCDQLVECPCARAHCAPALSGGALGAAFFDSERPPLCVCDCEDGSRARCLAKKGASVAERERVWALEWLRTLTPGQKAVGAPGDVEPGLQAWLDVLRKQP